MNIGLVFSGGGAKGAYQAGVVEALAEHNIDVAMISGASIGALNGAIVSASRNIATAAERLGEVWELVAQENVVNLNPEFYPRYLAMLAAAGLAGVGRVGLSLLAVWADRQAEAGLLDTSPLADILDRYLSAHELSNGVPLYVALYPYHGRLHAIKEFLKGDVIKRFDTQISIFKHIQSLSHEEQKEALLASAAIPVLFTPRKVGHEFFSDGGQGSYKTVQGNTPITPLLGQGLDAIIVSHLEDGSLWNADDFPSENIFELRPSKRISEKGVRDMLGFDSESISRWRQQGKNDTSQLLEKLLHFAGSRARLADSATMLQSKVECLDGSLRSSSLEHVMRQLKKC